MELTHDNLIDRVYDAAGRGAERVPLQGMIELTRLCTVRCTHCYIGDARWKRDPSELSTDALKSLLDTLAARGTLWLTFTGGEAMVRPDFRELWLYARAKGFLLTLFTNATLIDEEMADFLAAHPPLKIEVSIYGATAATYEAVTQIAGSYRRFRRGVDLIRARGLPWLLKAPLLDRLAPELDELRAQARDWHVRFLIDGGISPSIGGGVTGGKAPCATRLDEETLVEAELGHPGARRELAAHAQPEAKSESEALFTCGAGKNSFYVTAQGDLQMCVLTGHRAEKLAPSGDAIGERFDRAWERFGELRELKRRADSPCLGCDLSAICKSCPGFAHLESGDEQAAVEWLCRATHLKALKSGIPHRCDIKHFVYSPPKSQ